MHIFKHSIQRCIAVFLIRFIQYRDFPYTCSLESGVYSVLGILIREGGNKWAKWNTACITVHTFRCRKKKNSVASVTWYIALHWGGSEMWAAYSRKHYLMLLFEDGSVWYDARSDDNLWFAVEWNGHRVSHTHFGRTVAWTLSYSYTHRKNSGMDWSYSYTQTQSQGEQWNGNPVTYTHTHTHTG